MPSAYELGREAGRNYRNALLGELQRFADQIADSQGVSHFDVREAASGGGVGPHLASLGGGYGGGRAYGRGPSGGERRYEPPTSPDKGSGQPEERLPTDRLTPEPGPRGPDADRFERPDEPSDAIPKPSARPELPTPSEPVREPGGSTMPPVQPPEEWQRAVEEETIVGAASTYDPTRPGWKSGGMKTASGERYDPEAYTAAIQEKLRDRFGGVGYGSRYKERWADVTDPSTGKTVRVKINDIMRHAKGNRVLDLSRAGMRAHDPTMRKGVLGNMAVRILPEAPPGTYQGGPLDRASAASAGRDAGAIPRGQRDRPGYISGDVSVEGDPNTYHWGSGGRGRGSMPYGEYPITPGALGSIGRRLRGIGLNYNEMPDPKYPGSPRGGIIIHGARGDQLDKLYSAGCFAIKRSEWPTFRERLLRRIKEHGPMNLRVTPEGARISFARRPGSPDVAQPEATAAKIETLKTKPAEPDVDKEAFSPEPGMRKPREEKEAATPEKIADKRKLERFDNSSPPAGGLRGQGFGSAKREIDRGPTTHDRLKREEKDIEKPGHDVIPEKSPPHEKISDKDKKED